MSTAPPSPDVLCLLRHVEKLQEQVDALRWAVEYNCQAYADGEYVTVRDIGAVEGDGGCIRERTGRGEEECPCLKCLAWRLGGRPT